MNISKKLLVWLSIIATVIGIITGIFALYDRFNNDNGDFVIEQTIPKELLDKHKNGDTTIRIEKGITINPNE